MEPNEGELYRRLYFFLFNGVTAALEAEPTRENLADALRALQCVAEEIFCGTK